MHLFAGAGGGLLADLILGHEPVIAVEWDAYCCNILSGGVCAEHSDISCGGKHGYTFEDVADTISERQQRQGKPIERIGKSQDGKRETDYTESMRISGIWETEPSVGRVANGVAARVDRLKAIGNGQVPLQAALAWKLLGGP